MRDILEASLIRDTLNRTQAETIALQGLAYLAGQPEEMERFLRLSGLEVEDLRARAGDNELLAAVVGFLLGQDSLTTGFCESAELDPRILHAVQHVLSRP